MAEQSLTCVNRICHSEGGNQFDKRKGLIVSANGLLGSTYTERQHQCCDVNVLINQVELTWLIKYVATPIKWL